MESSDANPSELYDLINQLSEQQEVISVLSKRLSPVSQQVPTIETTKEAAILSDAHHITTAVYKSRSNTAQLRALIDSLVV